LGDGIAGVTRHAAARCREQDAGRTKSERFEHRATSHRELVHCAVTVPEALPLVGNVERFLAVFATISTRTLDARGELYAGPSVPRGAVACRSTIGLEHAVRDRSTTPQWFRTPENRYWCSGFSRG